MTLLPTPRLDRWRRMGQHCAGQSRSPTKFGSRDEEAHEQAFQFRPRRTGAGPAAPDRARGRRDRADTAPDAWRCFRPDRERALPRHCCRKSGRRRGAAQNFQRSGGDRQSRCFHRMVPRPVQRLRHDRGLSRTRGGQRDFQRRAGHPRLGRDRPSGAGGSRRLQGQRALGFRQRLAAGEWLGAHVRVVEADGSPRKAGRLAGDPHHPVPGNQRHDVRRLGRDRPQRHRHRLLLGG